MQEILKNIAKLIDVKSIMTLVLTGVFAFITIKGQVSPEQFMSSYGLVLGAFFSYQAGKKVLGGEKNDDD